MALKIALQLSWQWFDDLEQVSIASINNYVPQVL